MVTRNPRPGRPPLSVLDLAVVNAGGSTSEALAAMTELAQPAAIRRSNTPFGVDDYPRDVVDLMGLLGNIRGEGGLWERFAATPAAVSFPQILLLGSSDYSAQLAGFLGLPFAFAHHFDMGGTLDALDVYREAFRPSPVLAGPHVVVTASVLVAPTDADAAWESGPGQLMVLEIRTGHFSPLRSPAVAAANPSLAAVRAQPSNRILGSPTTVVAQLDALVAASGADEIMVSTVAYSIETKVRSLELLAPAWSAAGHD